ncbi:multiple C2 and transmembrane domain-containing protein 2 isoform X2 [Dunckerocampus dactyliophorus]|uniref:multiple C2 and transmembrane domain-containing protein 2 isoform X2 n=1 Tax=Dunckerocampus dactyliophorus TaxID=161453 RepID=UPI002406E032|nr:multiple C2 and transmembrane domain-containing protein 2 isoform X2 [Dunckerocampus dactyliophorus]
MEAKKKKKLLDNIRVKNKFVNLMKPGKKAGAKQGKKLAYRRSISVPDLRLTAGEVLPSENVVSSTASEAIFCANSPMLSDNDSTASGSIPDGSAINIRLPTDVSDVGSNSAYSSFNSTTLYEEIIDVMSSSEKKMNMSGGALYAQVDKQAKRKGPTFTFDPIPAQSSSSANVQISLPRLDSATDFGERPWTPEAVGNPGAVADVLARANSLGEQSAHARVVRFKQDRPLSGKGSPSPFREKVPLTLETLSKPQDSADGSSQYCWSGEDQVAIPWLTDIEALDQEPTPSPITSDCNIEESSLEGGTMEEIEMSSEPCDFFEQILQDPPESSVLTAGSDVQGPAPLQRYLLCISLKQGQNLVIRDKRSGTSDPYVKFKLEGKQFYKSKVVYKNLNPRWNEFFSFPLRDREHIVEVRVYDKNRTSDEFMGSSTIALKDLELYKNYEMELPLSDPKSKEENMGVINVDVCLMFRDATIKRNSRWPVKKNKKATQYQSPAEMQKSQLKSRMWTGVFAITLVEGQDLPQYGHGDIYVRFRLGDQKYKSKNLCIQANPQWREQFDFNQFADNQEPLQVEVYSKRGRKGEESWGMFEVDLSRLNFNERQLYTHVLDPGKGRLVFLVTLRPCWGVSVSDIELATLEKADERDAVVEKFSLKNSYKYVREIGFLQVKVLKANELSSSDLNGKSNPFCVIELGNSKLQTHTVYKTVNPEWNKALTFPVKDIHDVIELTILDENGDKAPNFLGKVAIPLLTVQNEQQICLFLKKEDLRGAAKGTVTLVLEVIYNKVRAGIRTFQPKEEKFTEENVKFSKKVLAQNIYRVRKISTAVLWTLQYIKSCFQWENTHRSLIAFLIFVVTVWHWELFMLPLFLLLLIGWNYFQLSGRNSNSNPDLEPGKKGIMEKIHMVQEVVLAVQNILEEIASIGERVKNIFNWSVPFMSCLACLVLFAATSLLYFIPLRYIVLIWGINKFTKKLRNPYAIDNNEVLDFLKRMPSDVQKVQYSALRAPSQSQPRKKK